jgi:hypothetical protein
MTKSGKNDKCPDYDRKNNEFMAYANPLIRKFHAKKIDEFRVWTNAYCTWAWYVAGNPKNTVLTQCFGWTAFLTAMYRSAIEEQYALSKSCVKQNGDDAANISVPAIPNFTCPTVVSFPVGMNALRLSAETINFDDNYWNIKHAEGSSAHNATMSFGIDKGQITEPGKYGNPYMKTGNGSANTSGINYAEYNDPELTPLSKIMDELTPLSKLPLDELAPLDPALLNSKKLGKSDLQKIMSAKAARKFLKEMMDTKCPGKLPVKKPEESEKKPDEHRIVWTDGTRTIFASGFEVTIGKVEFEPIFEVGIGPIEFEDDPPSKEFKVGLGELEMWEPDMQAWINTKGEKRYEEGFKEKLIKDVRDALTTSGMQVSISNGLEGLRNMNNVDRGLFDK